MLLLAFPVYIRNRAILVCLLPRLIIKASGHFQGSVYDTRTMGQGMKGRNKRIDQAVDFQVCTKDVCTARRVRTESKGGGGPVVCRSQKKKKTGPPGAARGGG